MAYDNTNSGAAFPNANKYSANSPDFRGTLDINGTEMWVSVWVKTAGAGAKNPGSKFLSLALSPKDEVQAPTPTSDDPLAGYGDNSTPATPATNLPNLPPVPSVPEEDDLPF